MEGDSESHHRGTKATKVDMREDQPAVRRRAHKRGSTS